MQRLAHETWDEVRSGGRRRATLDDLHQALRRLLAEQQMMFEAVWQRLTLAQRAVLRAVVLEEGRELLSADVRARHRLGGPSTVQAALGALVREDVISREGDRYRRRRLAAARMGGKKDVLDAGSVKVVIAGGTGFLGPPLTAALAAEGHEIVILTPRCGHRAGPGVQSWLDARRRRRGLGEPD